MDNINKIQAAMLTEREIIIYKLIESGMDARDLARRLGVSHQGILNIHTVAALKMEIFTEAKIIK